MLGIWRHGSSAPTGGDADDLKQELEYICGTLLDPKSTGNLKYLSLVQLAKKCVSAEFRRYVRSQVATLNRILQAMTELIGQGTAMCLAVSIVIYFLARDHKSIPITETTLRLIADLLKQQELSAKPNDAELKKEMKTLWGIIKDWLEVSSGKSSKSVQFDLSEQTLCSAFLMLEALAYISVSEHSALFKAELLSSGCLQCVVAKLDKAVLTLCHSSSAQNSAAKSRSSNTSPTDVLTLKEVERCLRILENAAAFDKKNQAYLINHRNGLLLFTCAKFLNHFHKAASSVKAKAPPIAAAASNGSKASDSGSTIPQLLECVCLLSKVMMNLSYENELCAMKLGQIAGFLSNCISTISLAPRLVDKDKTEFFDVNVMMYALLVNMVERCAANRRKLIALKMAICDENTGETMDFPVLEALTKLFIKHDSAARDLDEALDNDLAFEEEPNEIEASSTRDVPTGSNGGRASELRLSEDEIYNAIQGAMNKDSLMASYLALLIGCLIQNDEELASDVRLQFPDKNMQVMIEQLQRFLEFMTLTKLKSGATRSIERILLSMQAVNRNVK